MKTNLLTSSILLSSMLITGCVANNNQNQQPSRGTVSTPSNTPITQTGSTTHNRSAVQKSLAYMYDEERLAKEVYLAIYAKQPVNQLTKIATKAEVRHIDAVKDLAVRYGVATPYQRAGQYQTAHIQSLYNELYAKGIRSKRDALEVGCMVEVIDVEDLQKYTREAEQANAQDVVQTYNFLLKGTYNHYWAFDRGLKQLGVSNGCCSIGDRYCHSEYPQNQRGGRGNGQGRGQGHGQGRGNGGGWR